MSVDIHSDGKTVWVNSDRGMCIGRFCRWSAEVLTEPREGISFFFLAASPGDEAGWEKFLSVMKDKHGVEVPEKHKPRFLR